MQAQEERVREDVVTLRVSATSEADAGDAGERCSLLSVQPIKCPVHDEESDVTHYNL